MTHNILLAGFGGQGILFVGKILAYTGMIDNKEVSWLPSYGPEMRGGTANCSVCLGDEPIGSPLVLNPDCLIVMNNPSFDKFIDAVAPGGTAIVNSTLVDRTSARTDITIKYVPATQLANDNGLQTLGNMIMLGALLKLVPLTSMETVDMALKKVVPAAKEWLIPKNEEALRLGMEQ